MITHKFKALIILISIIIMGGCTSLKVTSDYDKSIDFSKHKTFEYYGWAEDSDKLLNRFDKERIEKAFGEEFKKRGLEYVESGGDLIVTLFIVTEQKSQTTATTTGVGGGYGAYGYGGYYGYGPGWGWGGGMSTTTYNTYDYTVGTLVVDVYDAGDKKLIWESAGQGTVDDNPNSRDENIPKAVAKIMNPYPIAAPKK